MIANHYLTLVVEKQQERWKTTITSPRNISMPIEHMCHYYYLSVALMHVVEQCLHLTHLHIQLYIYTGTQILIHCISWRLHSYYLYYFFHDASPTAMPTFYHHSIIPYVHSHTHTHTRTVYIDPDRKCVIQLYLNYFPCFMCLLDFLAYLVFSIYSFMKVPKTDCCWRRIIVNDSLIK